jgi:hypothetical protein
VKEYTDALRELCAEDHRGVAPYLLRTRFERNMYGLLVAFSETRFGRRPSGMTEDHIRDCVGRCGRSYDEEDFHVALSMARIFEKFTYLCDTSNWSNDGQDPRVEMCRDSIITLCDAIETGRTVQRQQKHRN